MLICQKAMIKTANPNDENAPGYVVFYCRITDTFHPVLPSLMGAVSEKRNFEGVCSHCDYWDKEQNIGTHSVKNNGAEVSEG